MTFDMICSYTFKIVRICDITFVKYNIRYAYFRQSLVYKFRPAELSILCQIRVQLSISVRRLDRTHGIIV